MRRASLSAGFAGISDTIEQAIADHIDFRRTRVVLVTAQRKAGFENLPVGLVATDQTYWYILVTLLILWRAVRVEPTAPAGDQDEAKARPMRPKCGRSARPELIPEPVAR